MAAPPAPLYALHPRVEGRIRAVVPGPALPSASEVARKTAALREQAVEEAARKADPGDGGEGGDVDGTAADDGDVGLAVD